MLALSTLVFVTALSLTGRGDGSVPTKPAGGGLAGLTCACPADFDANGMIDGADLAAVLGAWGSPSHDLDGNGTTDGADLSILLGGWGPCDATPVNDLCANALLIFEGETPFCTLGAETDGPAYTPSSGCIEFGYNTINADVWYSFVAPEQGSVTLSTCGTNFDTRLAVYEGASSLPAGCPTSGSGATELIACNDDHSSCGNGSLVSFSTTAGKEYKIRVGGYIGWSGEGVLNLEFDPLGSTCNEGIDLGLITSGQFLSGTTLIYEAGEDQSPCGLGDTTAKWYFFAVDCGHQNGVITISTCHDETDFDTTLAVWDGPPVGCPGAIVACNDDFADPSCQINGQNRRSRVQFNWVEPTIYYVRVSGYNGAKGDFGLSIDVNCN